MRKLKFLSFAISLVLFILMEVMLLSLAHWQYGRMNEQKELHAYVQSIQISSAQTFDAAESQKQWQPVSLKGSFDFSRQKVLINQRLNDAVGMRLVTPYIIENGHEVLVDRGWLPRESKTAQLQTPQSSVVGFVRHPKELKGWFKGPVYGLNENEIMRLEFSAFGENSKRLPIYVQAINTSDAEIKAVPDFPKDGSKNLEYMVTWSLCAAVLFLLYVYTVWVKTRRKS